MGIFRRAPRDSSPPEVAAEPQTRLSRRHFLAAVGLGTGASALSACRWDDNRYLTPVEQILPYVVHPEQIVPGTPTFFATTIGTGRSAWPVASRTREGRVINVVSNPQSGLARAVPKDALLELQRHYAPDRLKGPKQRDGGTWSDLTWEAGLEKLTAAVRKATAEGKAVAYLGPSRSGSILELIGALADHAVYWASDGRDAEAAASARLFGKAFLPAYDLSKAKYILSFGAEFLSGWGGTLPAIQYATARDPNVDHSVVRFALVSPIMGQTGANADDWYKAAPGAEVDVALAVGAAVAGKLAYTGPVLGVFAGADSAKAAQKAGIDPAAIDEIAERIAAHKGACVVLPGGVTGGAAGTDLATVCYAINLVADNAGRTFGDGPGFSGPVHGAGDVEALLAEARAGKVGVLLLDDTNPAYELPIDANVADALAKIDLIVGLSSHPDESNAAAHLLLPTSNTFEDWGDEEPVTGLHLLRQPSMTPLYDTRSFGDVLLAVGRASGRPARGEPAPVEPAEPAVKAGKAGKAGRAAAAPAVEAAPEAAPTGPLGFGPATWRDYVRARWQRDLIGGADFEARWTATLAKGVHDRRPPMMIPAVVQASAVTPGEAVGTTRLVVFPHPHRGAGRYANEPWAQEVADPMTGVVWDSWIEVAPATAASLGIASKDLVEVSTEAGKLQTGVLVHRGIADGVIALALGNGHEGAGRYAAGVGVNAVRLLKWVKDSGGAMVWQQGAVTVTPMGAPADLVGLFGSETDAGKHLVRGAPAATLAATGDAPAAHPGEMTGIHHLPRDPRLVASGNLEFYDLPDHPTYRFGMTVDTNACNGCGTCIVACYAENNLAVVGKELVRKAREMNWLRVGRYWDADADRLTFMPVMCQQCGHAPCESVCPVLATYHTVDGLNAMVYNRCVGTRYCANNCPYLARRFNFHTYRWPEPFNLQLNPDVGVRSAGVMEKCTFCVQRIRETRSAYRDQSFTDAMPDEALRQLPACADACPAQAITFGNLVDPRSGPTELRRSGRSYEMLGDLNTFPAVNYLAKADFHASAHGGHGGGHADAAEGGGHAPEGGGHAPEGGGHPGKAGKAEH